MSKYHLPLLLEEEALLARIDLTLIHRDHDEGHRAYLANKEPILALMASLEARGGIPEHWRCYWTDPAYYSGRIRASRKGIFERNNCYGDAILTHPHFIKHLRYLILGSELSEDVQRAFEREVENPQWLSPSDALHLAPQLRKMVRNGGMTGHDAAPEFFKLSLSAGLRLSSAHVIMRAVQQVK